MYYHIISENKESNMMELYRTTMEDNTNKHKLSE